MANKINPIEADELVSSLRSFRNSRAFSYMFEKLEGHYVNVLKSSNIGDLKASSAHASLRTLDDLKAQIDLTIQQGVS